jgi:hypothetical protein
MQDRTQVKKELALLEHSIKAAGTRFREIGANMEMTGAHLREELLQDLELVDLRRLKEAVQRSSALNARLRELDRLVADTGIQL